MAPVMYRGRRRQLLIAVDLTQPKRLNSIGQISETLAHGGLVSRLRPIPPQTANSGTLADLTLSFDVSVSGTEFANTANPLTVWVDQFPGGNKTFDASYVPTITTDGSWTHVSFSLDNLTPSGTSGAYYPWLGLEVAIDGGTGADQMGGDTAVIEIDNVLVTMVPEPGTIALLTLGGLGALVAIRRRSV